ncbi:hypothetical protein FOH10_04290 [Nocardia otitidiscaviarum]|uniref:Uncharacterized protein n=1 Tax=Nocardia otitidiscaviarum TaxID=1823 RepID=A0A516NWC0_9NOCA|nr:hypothetical protein [Nocardia otitidiscaviarum]QDP83200.1 hypothetical protein FOH10_04290 [Nocardia otitidiscaviarum]
MRWLYEEGLQRLAGVGARQSNPIAAYTVAVATGTVTVHPATGAEGGSDAITLSAEDLPHPADSSRRLVVVGITSAEAALIVDLESTLGMAINADRPECVARSWAMQLMLNPEITLTTNSAATAIGGSDRYRHTFIPGGGATLINIDDARPPITTVTLNPTTESPDHLDVEADGSGECYLGTRFWRLRKVMTIDDTTWSALSATLDPRMAEDNS